MITPWVLRPMVETSATRLRTRVPPSVIIMISSSSVTCTAPTTEPLRSLVWIEMTPWPPRPWIGYSLIGVRLP